jgi:hypothetical protein
VRQQYTFTPAGATSEVEDLNVALDPVTALELRIPGQRGRAYASLAEWRIALYASDELRGKVPRSGWIGRGDYLIRIFLLTAVAAFGTWTVRIPS